MTGPELHSIACTRITGLVVAIRDDQWQAPTPDTEWDVRQLVNHLTYENLWAPELLEGKTVPEVGAKYDGDLLGDDPGGAWRRSAEAAVKAFAQPGALEKIVHLSSGDQTAEDYCFEIGGDLLIHSWDLARAIGGNEILDPEAVRVVYEGLNQHKDQLASYGVYAPVVPVPDDADLQTKLLALTGRKP